MSTFGWVALAIGVFVLGQFLMLRPNPLEQQRMQLREAARKAGFQVYLRVIPDWLPEPDGRRLVGHYLFVAPEELRLLSGRYWRSRGGEWWAEGVFRERPPAGTQWELWGPRILGIESTANVITVFWLEEVAVQEISGLKDLMGKMASEISLKT